MKLTANTSNNIKDDAGNSLSAAEPIQLQDYRLIRNGIGVNWAAYDSEVDSRSFILDIELDEASEQDLVADMFSVSNAQITEINKLSTQKYRLHLTATRLGRVTVQLAAKKLQLADNIFNRQSTLAELQIFVDEQAPEVVINGFPTRDLIPGEEINLQFIFSEAIEAINQNQLALNGLNLMDFSRASDKNYSLMLGVADTDRANLEIQAIHLRDLSGNQAESGISLAANIRNNTAPVLNVPVATIVDAASAAGTPASASAIQNFLNAANAVDAEDGNITVTHNAPGNFRLGVTLVRFSAVDNQGLATVRFVALEVKDRTAPVISLFGDSEIALQLNATYNEAGASAIDLIDGDISQRIQISGSVDTSRTGSYTILYRVTDNAGNLAQLQRKVVVISIDNSGPSPTPQPPTEPGPQQPTQPQPSPVDPQAPVGQPDNGQPQQEEELVLKGGAMSWGFYLLAILLVTSPRLNSRRYYS